MTSGPGRVESPGSPVDDERVTAPSAPARPTSHRGFRLAAIVASVVAAIVGSVLLAVHRSSEKSELRAGPAAAPALPRGGKVVAAIRIGRGRPPVRAGGPLAVGEGAVWAVSNTRSRSCGSIRRRTPSSRRSRSFPRRASPPAKAPSGSRIRPRTRSPVSIRHEHGHRDDPCRPAAGGHRGVARRRLGRERRRPEHLTDRSRDESSRCDDPRGAEARLLRGAHEPDRVAQRGLGRPSVREQHRARRSGDEPRRCDRGDRLFAVRVPRRRQHRGLVGGLRRRRGRANRLSHEQGHGPRARAATAGPPASPSARSGSPPAGETSIGSTRTADGSPPGCTSSASPSGSAPGSARSG